VGDVINRGFARARRLPRRSLAPDAVVLCISLGIAALAAVAALG
jgi:hypothetical protein